MSLLGPEWEWHVFNKGESDTNEGAHASLRHDDISWGTIRIKNGLAIMFLYDYARHRNNKNSDTHYAFRQEPFNLEQAIHYAEMLIATGVYK